MEIWWHFSNTLGKFYHAWGYWGIIMGMGAFGGLLAFIESQARRWNIYSPHWLILLVSIVLMLLDVGVIFHAITANLIRTCLLLWDCTDLPPVPRLHAFAHFLGCLGIQQRARQPWAGYTNSNRFSVKTGLSEDILLPALARLGREQHGVLLDLACGESPFRKYFPYVEAYLRVDRNPLDSEVVEGDMLCIPMANQSVNMVLLCQAITDVPNPAAALKEVRRVLMPGGKLIVFESMCYP
ncbi:MAG: class I SAM-dependent methyltransferase, partial [Rhodocyclales bacterium]|nr:class I SAM-dependent methyltransferase [Rhodocyclales bacterium]